MAGKVLTGRRFDLDVLGNRLEFEVAPFERAQFQLIVIDTSSAPSSFIADIVRSQDGRNWAALATPADIRHTDVADAQAWSALLDVRGLGWLGLEVSAREALAADVHLGVWQP